MALKVYNTGVKAIFFSSVSAIVSTLGQFRLGFSDFISWRNSDNTDDLELAVNNLDQLMFNGVVLTTGGATSPGGSNKSVQFNQSGAFGGDSELTYDSATNTLTTEGPIVSTLATGTAPFTVASTTKVSNLNVDKLDSQFGSFYLDRANQTGSQLASSISNFTAAVEAISSGGKGLLGYKVFDGDTVTIDDGNYAMMKKHLQIDGNLVIGGRLIEVR